MPRSRSEIALDLTHLSTIILYPPREDEAEIHLWADNPSDDPGGVLLKRATTNVARMLAAEILRGCESLDGVRYDVVLREDKDAGVLAWRPSRDTDMGETK
jgi:hypothetical protein